jgi:hypothetical protein
MANLKISALTKNDPSLKGIQSSMKKSLYPQYGEYQKSFISPMKTAATNLMDNQYSMMTDPTKRGFSPEIQNQMFGKQADALTAARTSFGKENTRQVSAQGLGKTGQAMRNKMQYDSENAGKMREASRDVSLANAQQDKTDYWNAVQGYGGSIDTMRGVGAASLAGTQAENQMWDSQANIASNIAQLEMQQKELDSQGFWGTFKRGLGSALSGGLIGKMFAPRQASTSSSKPSSGPISI